MTRTSHSSWILMCSMCSMLEGLRQTPWRKCQPKWRSAILCVYVCVYICDACCQLISYMIRVHWGINISMEHCNLKQHRHHISSALQSPKAHTHTQALYQCNPTVSKSTHTYSTHTVAPLFPYLGPIWNSKLVNCNYHEEYDLWQLQCNAVWDHTYYNVLIACWGRRNRTNVLLLQGIQTGCCLNASHVHACDQ